MADALKAAPLQPAPQVAGTPFKSWPAPPVRPNKVELLYGDVAITAYQTPPDGAQSRKGKHYQLKLGTTSRFLAAWDEGEASRAAAEMRECASEPATADRAAGAQEQKTSVAQPPTPLKEEPPLSKQQTLLLDKVLVDRESIFITGAAGTGKSRLLRELIRRAPEESTFVTALTGMAATALPRGTTLHSFAGIGLGKGTKDQCLAHAQRSMKAKKNWACAEILVVDEASMMSEALFEKLEFVARKMRKKNAPFGGVLLCLCGDFFQIPPVSRGAFGADANFCFESKVWPECLRGGAGGEPAGENCFALMDVFRQREGRLLGLLSEVRHNAVTAGGLQLLRELNRPLPARDGVEATRLFPTNNRADAVNRERLAMLPGGPGLEAVFEAVDTMRPAGPMLPGFDADQLSTWPRRLELRVGAQVMLLKNYSQGLVNGSRGVVTEFSANGDPVVRFLSGEVKAILRDEDQKELGHRRVFARRQVPLRLSWALTIHKAQGMTIDYLEVDLQNVFEVGQAYVALSRASSLDGLRVAACDPRKFWTSPKVVEFYRTRVRPA